MSNTYKFVWTDELVQEYTAKVILNEDNYSTAENAIGRFKKSKEQVEEKRIDVKKFCLQSSSDKESWYEFLIKGYITEEKYEAVKQAIERELNGGENQEIGILSYYLRDLIYLIENNKPTGFTISESKKLLHKYSPTHEPQDSKEDKGCDIMVGDTVFFDVSKFDETNSVKTVEISGKVRHKFLDRITVEYFDPIDGQLTKRYFELKDLRKQPKEEPTAYQTYLRDCDCPSAGIIIENSKPYCRWCAKPYHNGGMINYNKERFK